MALREKAQETIAEAAELRRTVEETFLVSMRTELDIIRTLCLLAEQEDGEKRARHVQLAEKAFETVLELASRVEADGLDQRAIEEARENIRRLCGHDFSKPHD
jgi:hypothetical protein